jgi:transcriptional regulator GlxA family with amidase domain
MILEKKAEHVGADLQPRSWLFHGRCAKELILDDIDLIIGERTGRRGIAVMSRHEELREPEQQGGAERIGFLLLPEFPIYALILALEGLRVANQNAGARLFSTHLFSLDGQPVPAGNGMTLAVEAAIAQVPFFPTVIVCGGNRPTQHVTKGLLNWLRRLARHGALLGALDTGQFTLAAAGLLEGRRVTLHWEAIQMFREHYPDIAVSEQLYLVDRNVITCAGGIATLDMVLHLIGIKHGRDLAQIVADGFVHARPRREVEHQRASPDDVVGPRDPRLARVLRAMEGNLESPLPARALAASAGVSLRQLERLIRDRFDDTPTGYYLKLRLQAARNQLFYGDLPIQEIAAACGFSSPSVLSRTFRAHFGLSPRQFRAQLSGDQLRRFRPEIRQQLSF